VHTGVGIQLKDNKPVMLSGTGAGKLTLPSGHSPLTRPASPLPAALGIAAAPGALLSVLSLPPAGPLVPLAVLRGLIIPTFPVFWAGAVGFPSTPVRSVGFAFGLAYVAALLYWNREPTVAAGGLSRGPRSAAFPRALFFFSPSHLRVFCGLSVSKLPLWRPAGFRPLLFLCSSFVRSG